MLLKFTKMQGAGNDYIYINGFEQTVEDPESLSIRLSDRHFGVGGDGIVIILPSENCDFRMRMFNADGSEGKMCGNAARCVGKYVYEKGLTDSTCITLETLGGVKKLDLRVKEEIVESVSVNMGEPTLAAEKVPVISSDREFINSAFEVSGMEYRGTAVSMGNPHVVIFIKEIDNLDLEKIGPLFERNKIFPERVNTEFVEIIDRNTIKMRVWERGSGETLACGTGACAAAVAAIINGICDRDGDITVRLRGGELVINWDKSGSVFMSGPAEFAFDGSIKL